MAVIDVQKKMVVGKIVYYGPGLCGKTTNLEFINRKVPNAQEMMSLSTEGDRTIFFDYLPMDLGKIRGISTTFKLYTVPGQVRYNLTRKMVLKNVDGVVFVADSQAIMLDSNLESLENLYSNLRELGVNPDEIPIVLQYNKRDLPDLLSPEELDKVLNSRGHPVYLASAVKGDGVLETLSKISNIVFRKFMTSFGDDATPKAKKKKAARVPDREDTHPPAPSPAPPPVTPAPAPAGHLDRHLEEQDRKLTQIIQQNSRILETLAKYSRAEAAVVDTQKYESITDALTKIQGSVSTLTLLRADPFAGPGYKKLREESERIVKLTREGLASKKEIEDLRKALDEIEEKSLVQLREDVSKLPAVFSARLDEIQRTFGQALGELRNDLEAVAGLPTKKQVEDLQKAVDGIVRQSKAGSPDPRTLAKLCEDVSKLPDMFNARLGEIRRSFNQSLAEIRRELAVGSRSGMQPAAEAPPASMPPAPEEPRPVEGAPPPEGASTAVEAPQSEAAARPEESPAAVEVPPAGEAPTDQSPAHQTESNQAAEAPPPTEVGKDGEKDAEDPQQKNAERIARVMVADLSLYYADDVAEGIKTGDIHERMKKQFEEMRKTFNARVPEEVREKKDFLKEAIDTFIERKRKDMGV